MYTFKNKTKRNVKKKVHFSSHTVLKIMIKILVEKYQ